MPRLQGVFVNRERLARVGDVLVAAWYSVRFLVRGLDVLRRRPLFALRLARILYRNTVASRRHQRAWLRQWSEPLSGEALRRLALVLNVGLLPGESENDLRRRCASTLRVGTME